MNKLFFLLLIGSLLNITPAQAAEGDWDQAKAAHERGDYAAEIAIVRPLAEQGFAFAQFNMGVLYDEGHGVPLDDLQAMTWYRKAAEQGLPQAQVNLGIMHEQGEGGAADYVQAYFWYAMADSQGDHQAPQAIREIREKMTPTQIEEAQRKVKEWQATHTFTIPPLPAPEPESGNR
ncbi:MAG: sel1 repeat family protein [Candidatus Competibacteraceae bacterium]|nr:sel1 repeat family protein [Candidatus Competibacteraceae bacterium]